MPTPNPTSAPAPQRNPLLTDAMERFLVALRDGEDQYAICEGGDVWVDLHKFHKSTLNRLLQLCLLTLDSTSELGGTEIWTANSECEQILNNPAYIPEILKARVPND